MRALIVFFLLLSLLANGQHTISSFVADAFSKEPLGYVNIGIKKKNKGTLTNVNGKFRITIPEVKMEDSLTFSTVGYESKTFSIKDLITLKPDSIFLHQKTKELKEVAVIANGKWKTERIGISKIFPGVFGVVQSDATNDIAECAQQIDLGDELSKIIKFHIYLKEVKTDTANFRINFYAFDGGSPNERIFENKFLFEKK